jgi:hypothetical protein
MDAFDDRDDSVAELLEEDPKGVFVTLQLILGEIEDGEESVDAILYLAEVLAREEGMNIFRAMREHPEHTRDVFGIDPAALGDDLVAKVDAVME